MEDDYKSILSLLVNSKIDEISTISENYAKQLMSIHKQFEKRNQQLTGLLESYIEQRNNRVKVNQKLKKFIFGFFICLFSTLTISVVIFIICSSKQDKDKDFLVSLITVSVTYLVSLIAVFEIISKYLFPIDEEKDTVSMIQTVLNNDFKVEELISKAVNYNQNEILGNLRAIKQLHDDKILTEEEFNKAKKVLLEKLKR